MKHFDGKNYLELSFQEIPNAATIAGLQAKGVKLISYLGGTSYHAIVPEHISELDLKDYGLTAFEHQKKYYKVEELFEEPEEISLNTKRDFAVVFAHKISQEQITALFNKYQAEIKEIKGAGMTAIVSCTIGVAEQLNEEAIVSFIDLSIEDQVEALNFEARITHGVEYLQNGIKGYNLSGEGIVVGVGDGGELGDHIDLNQHVINEADGTLSSFGAHGDHVSGTIAGRGYLDPRNKGIAPNCTIVTEINNDITSNGEALHSKYNMVITNNSYGVSFECNSSGVYNYSSFNLDRQLYEFPELLHLFAAGNSGVNVCDGYEQGYKTVLKGYGTSKNVITVGSIDDEGNVAMNSSRGPVKDGRIKPEIVGVGVNIVSTGNSNDYFPLSGTSMATPAVSGSIALIYERYQQVYGALPKGDLIKALVCNSADDLGNEGPDFKYGFGLINPIRAIRDLDAEQFIVDHIDNGMEQIHTIVVPEGMSELKIMNYWHDHQAATDPIKALVNDLDIQVIDPDGNLYHPWVLNPDPLFAGDLPTRKRDDLNNIEQVTIAAPKAGTYRIKIIGTHVPMGNQRYNLTYNFRAKDIELTFPNGGERMIPGERNLISWITDEKTDADFKLEYSINGGESWTLIEDKIEGNKRSFFWEVPEVFTSNAYIRISNEGLEDKNEASFTIFSRPSDLVVNSICEDFMKLTWSAVANADAYQVYMYQDGQMIDLGETSETNFEVPYNYELEKSYWFAVASKHGDVVTSERTIAVPGHLTTFNSCPFEHDCKIVSVSGISNGREYTSISLSERADLKIGLKNVGRDDISDFGIFVQVNDEEIYEDNFYSTLMAGMELNYPFRSELDLTEPKEYSIHSWVSLPDDDFNFNDSLMNALVVMQLPNKPISFPYEEDFQDHTEFVIRESTVGLNGLDAWDFINEGNEHSDFKLIKGSENKFIRMTNEEAIENSTLLTLNLSEANQEESLYLSFNYLLSNQTINEGRVYVRGSDLDEWILIEEAVYTVSWRSSEEVELSSLLKENDQSFSSSTQIKFVLENAGTFNIDDIQLRLEEFLLPDPLENAAQLTEVFPNPFINDLKVNIKSKIEDQANFRLFDTGGKMIFETQEYLMEGSNEFSLQLGELLTSGIYFLSVSTQHGSSMHKVSKL